VSFRSHTGRLGYGAPRARHRALLRTAGQARLVEAFLQAGLALVLLAQREEAVGECCFVALPFSERAQIAEGSAAVRAGAAASFPPRSRRNRCESSAWTVLPSPAATRARGQAADDAGRVEPPPPGG